MAIQFAPSVTPTVVPEFVTCAECHVPLLRTLTVPYESFRTLGRGRYQDTGLCFVCPTCEDAYQRSIAPSAPLPLVPCSECGKSVPASAAIRYEIIEAIDGNEENLTKSNIHLTGVFGYECDACIEAYLATIEAADK